MAKIALAVIGTAFLVSVAVMALAPDEDIGVAAALLLFVVGQLTGIVLGFMSWREKLGKCAVFLGTAMMLNVSGAYFLFLYRASHRLKRI